jgi:hypothetical protein
MQRICLHKKTFRTHFQKICPSTGSRAEFFCSVEFNFRNFKQLINMTFYKPQSRQFDKCLVRMLINVLYVS